MVSKVFDFCLNIAWLSSLDFYFSGSYSVAHLIISEPSIRAAYNLNFAFIQLLIDK